MKSRGYSGSVDVANVPPPPTGRREPLKIAVLRGDDWHALYINGDLYYEGHSIPSFVFLEAIEAIGIATDEADYDFTDTGRAPERWPS